jgi:hypothetical protein
MQTTTTPFKHSINRSPWLNGLLLVVFTRDNNIALGVHAGFKMSTGSNNIHIGNAAAGNESGAAHR